MAEQTVEQLQETVVDLQKKYAAELEKSASLQEQLEASRNDTKIQADARLADLADAEKLLEQNEVLAAENEALKKRVAELGGIAARHELPSFEFEGATYEVLVQKAHLPVVGIVTASDILGTPAFQEKLVKSGSGITRKKA